MKQKITLLVLAALCVFTTRAQLIISQGFNSGANLTSAGWIKINNSSPLGLNGWFTGNANVFKAYSSPDSSYIAANYNNTTGSNGAISNWLITPTLTLDNGGIIQFATRTNTAVTVSPDRLELYMSTAGTGTNVGTTSTSVGTFSNLLVSVNAGLTTTGYPTSWTVYTATLSGFTGTVSGRFGFRYDVTSAGPTGANSSYIGIDDVKYSLPCPNPTLSISSTTTDICSGSIVTFSASGANTYTWSTGQTTSTIVVSPSSSTVYTLTGSSTPNCNSSETIAVTVTLTPNLSVNNVTTCPGTAATLAVSGASSYSWSTGATTTSVIVTPTANTTYSVTGYNGACEQTQLVSVALGASLSISASASQGTICSGKSATLMANGGSTYTWTSSTSTVGITQQNPVVTPSVTTSYTINASAGACSGMDTVKVTVIPTPTLSFVGTPTLNATNNVTLCPGSAISLTASGASSFSWTTGSNLTSVFSTNTPTTTGTVAYGVIGTGTNGCTSTAAVSVLVDVCTGIETLQANFKPVSIFPNPFGSELTISGMSGRIEVYNALGQLVLKQNVGTRETLSTEGFAKGVYVLKAYDADNKLASTVKLIKN